MSNRLLIVLAILALFTTIGIAQTTQNVKGTIIDKQSEIPLIGATIELLGTDNGTITDIDGYFRLENVPVGRHSFRVSYLGYNSITLPNMEVRAGKELLLAISLEESIEKLAEIVVTAEVEKDKAQNELATLSARTFSVEEVTRYSGGRSDVARLAANFAGVSTSDDSRNDIVIRGNSPTGVLWRLEGVPIPNPNHFSTLGTTGGPVSALNPNLLKNSDFITSAFPSEYGNALAGVFDLGFRSGNRDEHEFMFQIGAVSGVEVMAEGPINREKGSSYLIAGRYAFTDLATSIGLDIGTNAVPNYRDIAFKIDFGKSKIGKFTFFGIGGTSDIDFLHDEVDETDLFAAADEDAFATSQFGVIGLKHNLLIDDKTYVRTILSVSTAGNVFDQFRFFNMDTEEESSIKFFEADNTENRISINTENRISISSFVNRKFNAKWTIRTGVLIENFSSNLSANTRENQPDRDEDGNRDWATVYDFDGNAILAQAYIQTQYKLSKKWTLNGGLHWQYYDLNEKAAVEPRAAINYHINENQTINLGYGLHNQTQPIPIQLLEEETSLGVFEQTNKDLDFTRSHHFVVGYDVKLGNNWRMKLETYYQDINNVPVERFASSFSILNIGDDFGFPDDVFNLENTGTGSNQGIELTIERFFSKGFYSLITASIFDSKYKTTAGGRYFTPVDLEASKINQAEVELTELAFSERFDPYFRFDVKFGFKMNSKKRRVSHQFFVDIQNVTNRDNIFARRYNRQTNQVNNAYQLGFFPDFMYRIQF